jgi:Flp pilus assembly protein TadD
MVGAMAGGFLVSANVSFSLYRAASPLILAAFLAVVAASGPEATLRPWRGCRQRAWCAAGVVLVATLLVIHLLWAWDFLRADRLHRRIAAADAKMRWDQVVRDGARALGIKPNPRRLTTQLYVGRALVELRRPAEAIPLIEEVLKAYPHHLNAWYNLGLAYEGAGDDGNAIRAYREVLALSPDLFQAHDRLGCIYLRRAEFAEAEAAFQSAAVNAHPRDSALAWNNLGMVAIARKDYGTAERRFRKAVSLEPRGMLGHKNLGVLYLQYLDFPQESMVHLRRALELDPDMPEAESIRAILREFGAHADTAAIRRLVLELEFKETGKDLWNRQAGAQGVK